MSCHTNPYIDITLKKSGMWYRVTENSLGSSSPGKIDTKEVNERDSSIIIDKVTERGRKQRETATPVTYRYLHDKKKRKKKGREKK